MAGGALRELFVTLGIDADSKQLKEFDKGLKDIKTGMTVLAGLAGLVAAKMTAAFAMVENIASTGVELKRTAGIMGITTAELQKLRYAAKGVEPEGLTMAFRLLSKVMAGTNEETGKKSKVLQQMGVSAKDANGNMKPFGVMLEDLAEKFKGHNVAADKAAWAQQLFGRSGLKMVTMMNLGKDGIRALKQEFEDLGGVMSDQTIKDSEEFEHSMKKLHAVTDALKLQLGKDLIPQISKLIDRIVEWTKTFNKTWVQTGKLNEVLHTTKMILEGIGVVLAGWAIGKVVTGIVKLTSAVTALGTSALWASIKSFAVLFIVGAAAVVIVAMIADIYKAIKNPEALTVSGELWKGWQKIVQGCINEITQSLFHLSNEEFNFKVVDFLVRSFERIVYSLRELIGMTSIFDWGELEGKDYEGNHTYKKDKRTQAEKDADFARRQAINPGEKLPIEPMGVRNKNLHSFQDDIAKNIGYIPPVSPVSGGGGGGTVVNNNQQQSQKTVNLNVTPERDAKFWDVVNGAYNYDQSR